MKTRAARALTPIALILAWLLVGAIGGPYFGRVSEVAHNDQGSFLPTSAEATTVGQRYRDFVGNDQVPAIIVFTTQQALADSQRQAMTTTAQSLGALEGIATVSPPINSEDGLAARVFIGIDTTANVSKTVSSVREHIASQDLGGLEFHVTGPAGFASDLSKAFSGIDGLLLLVALGLVLVILLIVYRAVILPLAVLLTSVFALAVALLANWWLAKWGVLLAALHSPLLRGAAPPGVEGRGHPGRAARCPGAGPRLRGNRDSRAAVPAAERSELQPFAGAGGSHRDRLCHAGLADPTAEPDLSDGADILLAARAPVRS